MAGPLLGKKRILRATLETVQGTYVTPAQDCVVFNLKMRSQTEYEKRAGSGTTIGIKHIGARGPEIGICTFDMELRGNGTSGLEAGLAIMLQASGGKSATNYTFPTSVVADQKTLSLGGYFDGEFRSMSGCAGKWTFKTVGRKMNGVYSFEFTGVWRPVTAAVMPTYSPTATKKMWMSGFTAATVARKISTLSIEGGQDVQARPDPAGTGGILHYFVGNQEMTAKIDPEVVLSTTWDVDDLRRDGTPIACVATFTDGLTVVTMTMPLGDIMSNDDEERDTVLAHGIDMQLLETSGDDTLTIAAAAA